MAHTHTQVFEPPPSFTNATCGRAFFIHSKVPNQRMKNVMTPTKAKKKNERNADVVSFFHLF